MSSEEPWKARRIHSANELLTTESLRAAQVLAMNQNDVSTAAFIGNLMRALEYASGKKPSNTYGRLGDRG